MFTRGQTPRELIQIREHGYDRGASQYRRDDEIEARTENHQRLGGNLRRICRSFPDPVRVLEIGCGTGRYFHWLENVDLLVGVDLSAEMLREAERPLFAEHHVNITISNLGEDMLFCVVAPKKISSKKELEPLTFSTSPAALEADLARHLPEYVGNIAGVTEEVESGA